MGLTSAAHNGLFNLHSIKKQKQWTMNKKSEPEFMMFNYIKNIKNKNWRTWFVPVFPGKPWEWAAPLCTHAAWWNPHSMNTAGVASLLPANTHTHTDTQSTLTPQHEHSLCSLYCPHIHRYTKYTNISVFTACIHTDTQTPQHEHSLCSVFTACTYTDTQSTLTPQHKKASVVFLLPAHTQIHKVL